MRVTITPLGGAGRAVTKIVAAIVHSPATSSTAKPSPASPAPIDHAVTRRLARSTGELTAWALDQAIQVHALGHDIDAIGF